MNLQVFLMRAVIGVLAAWTLLGFFSKGTGWVAILSLAALLVGAAYIIERMKRDRGNEKA
ncbi:MAG: hypothetical protein V2A77_07245 [Pseudomonadota bacterium]